MNKLLERHLTTIVEFTIDATIVGVKYGFRKLKQRKAPVHASNLSEPMQKSTVVDGAPTLITIHPAK